MNMYKTVYVIGVFDLFHRGHVALLKQAKSLGEKLIVAVNSDDLVADYKTRPVFSEEDRLTIVEACRYVDEAFVIHSYDNRNVIKKYKVDAIVHGNDWEGDNYLRQIRVTKEFLDEHSVEMVYVPYTKNISSSQIKSQIKTAGI